GARASAPGSSYGDLTNSAVGRVAAGAAAVAGAEAAEGASLAAAVRSAAVELRGAGDVETECRGPRAGQYGDRGSGGEERRRDHRHRRRPVGFLSRRRTQLGRAGPFPRG